LIFFELASRHAGRLPHAGEMPFFQKEFKRINNISKTMKNRVMKSEVADFAALRSLYIEAM
jgi:hypothetical protein